MHTAIVTYGRGWPALAIVRSLGARGVRVVVGDCVRGAPSAFSRHAARSFRYPDPGEDAEGFLARLEEVIREEKARGEGEVVLLPVHRETFLCAEHRARLEAAGARMALPEHAHIEATHDKGRLADLAEALGIRIPNTARFHALADVYRAAPDLAYPAFVKLRGAAAGVGVVAVNGPRELVEVYERFVDGYALEPADFPIVQAFAPGSDYCVSVLCDRGRAVASHTYRNLRQFPRGTGAGVLRESVRAPEAEAVARRLLEHLRWHGLAQLDFRWTDGGEPHLIELNPRFFGGLPQAIAAGVDYPWLVFQLALGERFDTPAIDYAVRTETPVLGVLATLGTIRRDRSPDAPLGALRAALEVGSRGVTRRQRARRFFAALRAHAGPSALARYLGRMFAKHRGTVNDVARADDLWPVLGLLFPLAVLVRHGTLDTATVLSEAKMKSAAPIRKGFRGHLRPSPRTLVATAIVFLVSVAATHLALADGSVVEALFEAPARALAIAAAPSTATGYALFHLGNFAFLYVLAAFALKVRERLALQRALARARA